MKEPLRNRDLRVVLAARATSVLGDAMALMALMLVVARSGEPALLTPIMIAFAAPTFLLAGWAGRLVDRHDSRRLLVLFGSLQAFASVGLLLSDQLIAQVVSILLLQSGQAVTGPTWGALLPRIVGEERLGRAIGLQQTLLSLAGLLGSALAGFSFDLLGYRGTIAVDTATFALLVASAFAVRTRRIPVESARTTPGTEPSAEVRALSTADRSVWAVVRADRIILTLLVVTGLFIIAAEGLNVVEVFLVTDALGASGTTYGLLVSLIGVGAVASPLVVGRIEDERRRIDVAALGLVAMGVGFAMSGLVPSWGWLAPLFILVGLGNGAVNALAFTLMVGRSPETHRGRVIALTTGICRGCSVLALALGGWAGGLLGPQAYFVIAGVIAAATGPIVLTARKYAGMPKAVPTELVPAGSP
jgi:MFS family permease